MELASSEDEVGEATALLLAALWTQLEGIQTRPTKL